MGPEIAPPTPQAPPPYPYGPPPHAPRRLVRSSRDRMWAGVAGGLAEYFDLDPALVRLMWVAAAVVSGGLAVPFYIVAAIILPRDDRPPQPGHPHSSWRDWSQEFHSETQRLAEEARRMAEDVREGHPWHEPRPGTATPPNPEPVASGATSRDPATDKGTPTGYTYPEPTAGPPTGYTYPEPTAGRPWSEPGPLDAHRNHRGPRSAGVILVGLGILLLAGNAGLFRWIDWHTMWPLIFIGLGLILLARQTNWGR